MEELLRTGLVNHVISLENN